MQRVFSAAQTEWRRERDSNPRYPLRYSGFQDRLFQPLTHPSAAVIRILTVWQHGYCGVDSERKSPLNSGGFFSGIAHGPGHPRRIMRDAVAALRVEHDDAAVSVQAGLQ